MKQSIQITFAVIALSLSTAGALYFEDIIVNNYEHAEQVVLILKLGVEPSTEGMIESQRQGKLEAYAQLGAYTSCIVLLILSLVMVILKVRMTIRSNRSRRNSTPV